MALQSQAWSPATPMPMAESSLYRQRLEVIAEKRRLQEEIRAARRDLEEEKLRVERLKRKSLRERWLMDGAAEGPEQPEDPASKDPQSPEGQAQARIRNLEDSLFTLQSQLQLLQSASTGAQHKPSARPTWRRQGHRPLSQPTMEAAPTGRSDLDKRASLPTGLVGVSPEFHSEPGEEAAGVLPHGRQVPGAAGASSEANGPYPGPSPTLEQLSLGVAAADGGTVEAKGGDVVEVVWEGLRATEDCATGTTGLELEAKVEEVVLEAIGDRQGAGSMELPVWVKEDRGVVEVVWEGLGGSESLVGGEPSPGAAQTSSPRLLEQQEREAAREGGAAMDSPKGGGEEGSFIWVERATLSEDWEELLMEGLEGPVVTGKEGEGGEDTWEEERRRAEGAGGRETEANPGPGRDGVEVLLEAARKGSEAALEPQKRRGRGQVGTEEERGEEPLGVESKDTEGPSRAEDSGGEKQEMTGVEGEAGEKLEVGTRAEDLSGLEREVEHPLETEKERGEEKQGTEKKEVEGALGVEDKGGEEMPETAKEPSEAEREGGQEAPEAEREGGQEAPEAEREGGQEAPEAEREGGQEAPEAEREGGQEAPEAEREGGQEAPEAEREGGQEAPEAEREGGREAPEAEREGGREAPGVQKTQGSEEELSSEVQRESEARTESQAEVSEAGAPLGVKQEPVPEEGLQSLEKQEGALDEEAGKLQLPAQSQGPPGDATPLLAETPAPEQPTESQPLLQRERPSANPSARPVPTYAPSRQFEAAAPAEGEEASGPKQKTCQCCVVM